MCGIIGVVRRPGRRVSPSLDDLVARLRAARDDLVLTPGASTVEAVARAAGHVEAVDAALRGTPGVRALLRHGTAATGLRALAADTTRELDAIERDLDRGAVPVAGSGELEQLNAAIVRCKDALWAVARDRLRTARAVADLASGFELGDGAIEVLTSVQVALSAIDRLEVRGRDSAGVHLLVRDHALDLADPTIARLVREREADALFRAGAVRMPNGLLSVVYKAAAEIGELGDNVAALRAQIAADALLHLALARDDARATVLGHTRWASVGIISEANAHPLNQEEVDGARRAYVTAALNGDVDNHADLRALDDLHIASEITTDAKVIPTLVSQRIDAGMSVDDGFRATVASLEGSVAIAASSAAEPDELHLALRGSGQALYVGLAQDSYV
ncbi:MAG TPA: glucosamine-6-phosphate synthase, partial [Acidimicrobiia bacterium]|nr:glucosamine-6-phosphate synthase [Acidimicrobiia bacterium]